MTTTIDIAAIAAAVTEQRGRELYQESKQAINRAVWELGKHLDALTRAKLLVACGLSERYAQTVTGVTPSSTPKDERQAFPGTSCPYCRTGQIILVEQGYERTWTLTVEDTPTQHGFVEGVLTAHSHGSEDFSDDGDCEYYARCSSCLVEFQAPDDEWEWN
jgi:hypothetical protein